MNPALDLLHPYPFEKLRTLFAGVSPPAHLAEIRLSIGEPRHPTPQLVKDALINALDGLAHYPLTAGAAELRAAIADWLTARYQIPRPDTDSQIIPVNGSREALFAFSQCAIDASRSNATVLSPNPFYQIYEGAALLAGAQVAFYNQTPENDFAADWARIPPETWQRVQLVYVCSPGNPTGKVMSLEEWRTLFNLADQYDFVIASDECYGELYFDEAAPPLGALTAARRLGRKDYQRLIVFGSLSKRSNAPGLRSGFVTGDANLLARFLRYRTYHGCAMSPPVQQASIAAWRDEAHVRTNRSLYREKFALTTPLLAQHLTVRLPDAGFYLWAKTPLTDTEFARALYAQTNVIVLPGSFLARENEGINPGHGFVRIALVANLDECLEAARRIDKFCATL